MYFRNAAGNSGIIWCPLLISHSAGNSTPTEQFKNEKWTHWMQGKLFNPGYLLWVFKPLHSVSLLIWTGKVWDKERSDFYLKLCQPKQSEDFCVAVKAGDGWVGDTISPEQQRTPQRAPGVCRGENEVREVGKVTNREKWDFNPTNLHLLHCRNILSFDLVGGFGETFLFILPLLANHFAGKHGVLQTWKYPPPPLGCQIPSAAAPRSRDGFREQTAIFSLSHLKVMQMFEH